MKNEFNQNKSYQEIEKYVKKFQDEIGKTLMADIKNKNENSIKNEAYKPIIEDPMYTLTKNDVEGLTQRSKHDSELYNAYIQYYKDKCNQNLHLKCAFFVCFMLFLKVIIIGIHAAIIILAFVKNSIGNTEVICAVSGSAATIVTSIIVIPKIIAKYLFSTEEDAIISDLLKEIQIHDIETRKNYIEKQ